jgi:hypothetical protein
MKPIVHALLALALFNIFAPGVGDHAGYITASLAFAAGANRSKGMAVLVLFWLALLPDDLVTEAVAVAVGIVPGTALRLLIGGTHEPLRPAEQTAHGNDRNDRPLRQPSPPGRDDRNNGHHGGRNPQ